MPATKAVPKEMLPVLNKPLIQYAVEEALKAGISRFIFVTGKGKDAIENHFDRALLYEQVLEKRHKEEALRALSIPGLENSTVVYVRQGIPQGLGHAVWCARHLIDEPFAVLLADDLVLPKNAQTDPEIGYLMAHHAKYGGQWASTQEVPLEDTRKYGVLDVAERKGEICVAKGVVEKPDPKHAPSTTAILGRYVLDPQIFELLDADVKRAGGIEEEVQLTDAICKLIPRKPLYGLPLKGLRFDCGSKQGMFRATLEVASADPDLAPFFTQKQQG